MFERGVESSLQPRWLFWFAVFAAPVGLLLSLPPLNLWPLALVALVPLFLGAFDKSVSNTKLSVAALLAGALYWALATHEYFAGAPHRWLLETNLTVVWAVTIAVFLGLALLTGLGWAAAVMIIRRLSNQALPSLIVVVFGAVIWVAFEMLRTTLATEVGLGVITGYSLPAVTPFGHVAQLGGVWLVSGLLIAVNLLIAQWWLGPTEHRRWPVMALVVLVGWFVIGAGCWLWNRNQSQRAPTIEAVAIQRHRTGVNDLGDPSTYDQQLLVAQQESAEQRVIVMPEVSYAIDSDGFQRMADRPAQIVYPSTAALFAAGQQKLADGGLLVAGVVDTTNKDAWRNEAAVVSRDGTFGITPKRHLIVFGEFLPLRQRWPAWLQERYKYQISGQHERVQTTYGLLGALFCNELLAPGSARSDARSGAQFLPAISSDFDVATSLFSRWQLRAASYRAVETGRAVVLAADQTQSAIIRPTGSLLAVAGYASTGAIHGMIPLRTDQTPWVRWAPVWAGIMTLLLLTTGVLMIRKRSA